MTIQGDVFSTNQYNDYSTSSLGTSSTQLIPSNANRRYLLIQNNSAVVVWLNFGTTATTAPPSIQLLSGGVGVYEQEGNDVYSGAIFAIAASGSSNAVTAKDA